MRFGTREIIFLIVLIAVPIASWWFVFRPQNEEINQARLEIEHKEQMLQRLAETTERTADLAKANEELGQEIELIEARLPSTKEVDVILEQVASLAIGHRLRLPVFRTDRPVEAAAYMEQPLEMRILGDFDSFYSFLLSLERLERITRMPKIVIKRSDKTDGEMEATFTLSIYFEPEIGGGRS